MTTQSQNRQVLNWLKSGNGLTAKNAADYFGIYRLSARIFDLRRQGVKIDSKLEFDGSAHWSVYRLARPQLKPGIKNNSK